MLYRRKKRGFFYYLKTLIYTAIMICGVFYLYKTSNPPKTFDAEKILSESVLQNKTFAAKVKEIETDNVKAYLLEEHSNPIVSLDFTFKNAGYAYDKTGKFGLANIASDLIMDGAGKYSEQALLDLMEENGIKIGFGVSRDDFSGSMVTPKNNLKTALSLLRQILYSPRLPENHLEIIKAQMIKSLQLQQENPNSVLSLKTAELLYGTHPYARNPVGKKADIENITTDDVRGYLKDIFAKQNLVIGIAGDVSEDESKQLLKDVFAALPEQEKIRPLEKFEYDSTGKEFNINREIPQVIATFSVNGVYREDDDFYPLYLANYIFGEAGLTSRLNKVIREKNGLTYGIYTTLAYGDASALIIGGFSAESQNYEKAKQMLLNEWSSMAEYGISIVEFEKAKKSLVDSFNLRFADIGVVSNMLVAMQKYNLGTDFLQKRNSYIKNIKLSEVNEATKKYYGVAPDFVTIGTERK